MTNRLAVATSPYLLQHADNPVDWWEWSDEAFAEARRRDVPVLVSVGYAACHWCHVMAHESFEDDETAAFLNQHFVAVKVDREERPDVDAVYMEATQAHDRPRRLADDGLHHADRRAVLLRHVLPADPAARDAVVPAAARLGRADLERAPGRAGGRRAADRRGACRAAVVQPPEGATAAGGRSCLAAAVRSLAAAVRRGVRRVRRRAEVPAVDGARAAVAPPRAHRRRGGAATGRGDLRGDGPRRHLRPARRRLRAVLGRRGVGGAALREDVVRQRIAAARLHPPVAGDRVGDGPAGGSGDGRLDAARAAYAGGRLRLGAGRGHRRRRGQHVRLDAGSSWSRSSATDDGAWAASAARGDGGRHVRARRVDAAAAARPGRRAALALACATGSLRRATCARSRPATTRWSRPGTVSRSPRLPRPGALLDRPDLVAAADAAADLLLSVHLVDGRLLPGVARRQWPADPAGVLEDYADVAEGLLALYAVTGDPRWLRARRATLLDVVLEPFADGSGGFFDTADDRADAAAGRRCAGRRTRPTTPRPPGRSAAAGALLTLRGVHRVGAGTARRPRRRWPSTRRWRPGTPASPGGAWRSPRRWSTVRARSRSSATRPTRRPLALHRTALLGTAPGAAVALGEPGLPGAAAVPLLADRPLVGGRPTAYVCRHFVCDGPDDRRRRPGGRAALATRRGAGVPTGSAGRHAPQRSDDDAGDRQHEPRATELRVDRSADSSSGPDLRHRADRRASTTMPPAPAATSSPGVS